MIAETFLQEQVAGIQETSHAVSLHFNKQHCYIKGASTIFCLEVKLENSKAARADVITIFIIQVIVAYAAEIIFILLFQR
jgi:hypothetical protein